MVSDCGDLAVRLHRGPCGRVLRLSPEGPTCGWAPGYITQCTQLCNAPPAPRPRVHAVYCACSPSCGRIWLWRPGCPSVPWLMWACGAPSSGRALGANLWLSSQPIVFPYGFSHACRVPHPTTCPPSLWVVGAVGQAYTQPCTLGDFWIRATSRCLGSHRNRCIARTGLTQNSCLRCPLSQPGARTGSAATAGVLPPDCKSWTLVPWAGGQ